jgi:hypothetical protein
VAGAAGSRHCSVTLGYFAAELEAARAYDEVAGPLGRRTNGITWEQVAPMILAARRDLDHAERLKDRGAVVGAAKALEHLRARGRQEGERGEDRQAEGQAEEVHGRTEAAAQGGAAAAAHAHACTGTRGLHALHCGHVPQLWTISCRSPYQAA